MLQSSVMIKQPAWLEISCIGEQVIYVSEEYHDTMGCTILVYFPFIGTAELAQIWTQMYLLQKTYLIEVIRLLIESETVWEWPASTDHVGGSFGLIAKERAVLINKDELSSIVLAEIRIGSCALDPCGQKGAR